MSLKCTVKVIEARGIKASDPNGKSDPYVKVRTMGPSGSSEIKKSEVQKKTLTPVWNQDFFFQPVDRGDVLEITLWDKDRFKDDFLGEVRIPLASCMNQQRNEWLDVMEKQHGMTAHAFKLMSGAAPMKPHGQIHIQVYVGTGAPSQMGGQPQQQYSQFPNQQYPAPQPTNPYISQTPNTQTAQYGMPSAPPSQPPQYGMSSAPYGTQQAQPPQYGMQSAQPPQYGMQSSQPGMQSSQPPQYAMQSNPSQPPQYGMQAVTPQQSYQGPNQFNQNAYGVQPTRPPQPNNSFPSQYPQNTPGAQIPSNPVQYPQAMQPNQYRDAESSQFPDQWGPKPDFSTLSQPSPFGSM